MGDLDGSRVEGEEGEGEGLTPTAILDPVILRFAVLTYLVVLPVGHLFAIPVSGTTARASDVFLALVLLAGIIDLGRMSGRYLAGGERFPLLPGHSAFHVVVLFITAFSAWVALSAAWGPHPTYAVAKGLAFGALSMGALAILWCGAGWARAADAWLLGTLICLVVTWIGILVGPDTRSNALASLRRVHSRPSNAARIGTVPSSEHVRRLFGRVRRHPLGEMECSTGGVRARCRC